MLQNYIKIALRNIANQKSYSLINIAGLAIGIACCLLILQYIRHELSYDRYHEKAERTYRVTFSGNFGSGDDLNFASVAAPTAEALVRDYPQVLEATRLYAPDGQRYRLSHRDMTFIEKRVAFADANIFEVFTIPLLRGDPATALAEPSTIVISEAMADKYFANHDPVGKILTFNSETDYLVTGVFRDIPGNTHFHLDFLVALATLEASRHPGWLNNMSFHTYVVLRQGADANQLQAQLPGMVRKYCAPIFEKYRKKNFEELTADGLWLRYTLQPLTDIHLHSDLQHELEPNGDIKRVYLFGAIALVILLIACINFMNLSTARSASRAKEVGIRKVVGSRRAQLISQFIAESVVVTILALVLGLLLAELALPYFNNLARQELQITYVGNAILPAMLFAIVLFVGVLSGSYPAVVLSGFRPIAVLTKHGTGISSHSWVRSGLVIFQFAASIVLVVGAGVVFRQMQFVQNKKLGFDKEQVFVLHDAYLLGSRLAAFKHELLTKPEIASATATGYLPVTSERTEDVVQPEGEHHESGSTIQKWTVDFDYVKTMRMKLVQGRDFSKEFATDSTAAIVNEAAVKVFGWDEPIGKRIRDLVAVNPKRYVNYEVVGVVRDFHFESLRDKIGPVALLPGRSSDFVSLRLKTNELAQTIGWIKTKWDAFVPGQPFEYSFLNQRFNEMYRNETRTGSIFGVFAGLAITLGCLGLFGLASFTAERRTKEIGIRKTLGASVTSVVRLLSWEFTKLILFANIIALPVAFVAMNSWLQGFAYRPTLGPELFILAGGLAFVIALLTVSVQATRAALADPVRTLRYE